MPKMNARLIPNLEKDIVVEIPVAIPDILQRHTP
jgi:hypothetical protein